MSQSKFNKSEILKKAWSLVRRNGYTLANALRASWQYARNKANQTGWQYKGSAEQIFSSPTMKSGRVAALKATLERGARL